MSETVQPEENIWKDDLLGREAEGAYLRRYIERLYDSDKKDQTSFVLNINSEWGHGKTWFLKNLSKELCKNHPVIYFDAWKNDFSNDALLSFVSVVCNELSKLFWKKKPIAQKIAQVKSVFSSISKNALPILLSVLVKQLTGKGLDDVMLSEGEKEVFVDASDQLSKVVASSMIDGFIAQKNAIDDFSCAVQSLVEEINRDASLKLPICIMVDELDRCRPTYAIELLEAIKHLFSINGIFFILATDTRQLGHSIKAIYGERFNSSAYLKRFFYAEYQLANPDYERMANFLFDGSSIAEKVFIPEPLNKDYGVIRIFSKTSEFFKLTARDQEQVFAILKTIFLTSEKRDVHYILILLLICLNLKFDEECDHVFYHRNNTQLTEFFKKELISGRLSQVIITTYAEEANGDTKKQDVSITSLFEYYFQLVAGDGNLNRREIVESHRLGFIYQQNIGAKLLQNKNRDHRSGNYLEKHDLSGYFELLTQAGRITVG